MNKGWRPKEGWAKPYRLVVTPTLLELAQAEETNTVRFLENEAYEAGADAMLKALRVRKKETPNPWEYIPDDED